MQLSAWFMPVILATQEVEIKRTAYQSQTQAKSSLDPMSKTNHHKKRMVERLKR
jgi:hypothetical protein